jgi:hypothetical protein
MIQRALLDLPENEKDVKAEVLEPEHTHETAKLENKNKVLQSHEKS